ncbi:hypothetical protein, partial [Asanoa sp. NPDC050611]|uniref:hypothetical protein n=1 Tax=Asanoa sp. NPDC050611 TaxID=3157098 RepID=UPI00340F8369
IAAWGGPLHFSVSDVSLSDLSFAPTISYVDAGPYKVKTYTRDNLLELERNPNWDANTDLAVVRHLVTLRTGGRLGDGGLSDVAARIASLIADDRGGEGLTATID